MGRRRRQLTPLYQRRPSQEHLHASLKRFNVLVAHRRFGKTVFSINELVSKATANKHESSRYAYIAPLLSQAKDVAWEYLKRYATRVQDTVVNESELRVDLPAGSRIRLYGADNPDRLRGLYLDGVVLDEYAQMPPRLWPEVIRPTLADRNGWAIFIGTPMGRNAFCELYEAARADPNWFTALFRASETGIIAKEELAAAAAAMSDDQYAQEFECSFDAAVVGSYYGKLLAQAEAEGRVGEVPWEPQLPVHTAWDLGIGDSTAIWFCQIAGGERRLIDYYESSGVGLDHYAGVLRGKPYRYGDHILPHDAEVRELGTGLSRVETLRQLGVSPRVLRPDKIEDGINAARILLPLCRFDAGNCARGIEALRQYRREYDERLKAFRGRPLHDWTSHAADAFRYLAMGLRRDEAVAMRPIRYESRWIV